MSEKSREQISVLMDDEQEAGTLFVLNAMSKDNEYRETWKRYHLIGETLRGNLPSHIDLQLAERVSLELEKENSLPVTTKNYPDFLKPLAGFAIAASVAVVAILGVRQSAIEPAAQPVQFVAQQPVDTAPLAARVATGQPVNQSQVSQDAYETAEARLNRYLLNYNEYRTNAGVQGMLPYVRIVAHDVEE